MYKSVLLICLISISFTYNCPPARADAADEFNCVGELPENLKNSLISKVEARYLEVNSLVAAFSQRSTFIGLEKQQSSSGRLSFLRPGMMDWVYQQPEEQRFVADGATLWFFQPALDQVTVGDFKNSFSSDLPVTFLLGLGKLSNAFSMKNACKTVSGILLDLRPKDENLESFALLVRANDYTPIGARILDAGGNETSILFAELQINSPLKKEQFSFVIPQGIDVIDQRKDNAVASDPKKAISETNLE
jgi:outer membrane lipoprotein carrier protein